MTADRRLAICAGLGARTPLLGGEFRLTFRVHDLSHNEVQNWRRQCGQHCSQHPKKWPISSAAVTFVSLSLLIDNALYEKGLVSPRRSVSGQYAGVCATGSSANSTRYFGRMEADEQRGSRGAGRPRATSIG